MEWNFYDCFFELLDIDRGVNDSNNVKLTIQIDRLHHLSRQVKNRTMEHFRKRADIKLLELENDFLMEVLG